MDKRELLSPIYERHQKQADILVYKHSKEHAINICESYIIENIGKI